MSNLETYPYQNVVVGLYCALFYKSTDNFI